MFVGEICCGRLLYDEMMLVGDEPLSTAMAIGETFEVLYTAEQMTDDNHERNLTSWHELDGGLPTERFEPRIVSERLELVRS